MKVSDYIKYKNSTKLINKKIHRDLSITDIHFEILFHIYNSKEQMMNYSEVKEALSMHESMLTKQLNILEQRAFISKERDKSNQRKVIIKLNKQQKKKCESLIAGVEKIIEDLEG